MVGKVWKVKPPFSNDLVIQLLHNRGIKTPAQREEFLNPSIENYPKELAIAGIKNAQKRIQQAIDLQELIVVYGDYDVDGVCASAILYKGLSSLGAKVLPYIPHREKEGYGLSNLGLEFARDSGASVVITVDNGIVALKPALYARELGLDLIITDHHLPLEKMPEAFEIVHSTKMCGAAVTWCMIESLVTKGQREELLELVGIATVCDMMPLKGINRAFVFEGLKVLNRTKNLGLQSLILECGIGMPITAYEIGHMIGPRINAIGRLEHAIDALRLICTSDSVKAKKLARLLGDNNLKRQQLTISAVDEARILVEQDSMSLTKKIHVVSSDKWIPGIIGLIASRICEQYYRPAIALSVGSTHSKGSARSINGINIVELIRSTSDILVDVGGHSGAAGFTIANEKIPEFKKRLEVGMDKLGLAEMERVLEIEAEVKGTQLTKKLVKELEQFEPCGFENPKPVFVGFQMKVTDVRTLSEGKHLKFRADGIDAIAFGMGEYEPLLQNGQLADVAFYLELNKFNSSENLQLKVKDIRIN